MDHIVKRKWIVSAGLLILLVLLGWMLMRLITGAQPITAAEAADQVKGLYAGEVIAVTEVDKAYLVQFQLPTGIYEVAIDKESGKIGELYQTNRSPIEHEALPEDKQETANGSTEDGTGGDSDIGPGNDSGGKADAESGSGSSVNKGENSGAASAGSSSSSNWGKGSGTNDRDSVSGSNSGAASGSDSGSSSDGSTGAKKISQQEAIRITVEYVGEQQLDEIDDIEMIQSGGVPYYLVEFETKNDEEGTVQINAITGKIKTVIWDED